MNGLDNVKTLRWTGQRGWGIPWKMNRTKEPPSSMSSPGSRTALPGHTTGKKITRRVASIPDKHGNMRVELSTVHKKLIVNP